MRAALIMVVLGLAGCGFQQTADSLARNSAKTYVNSVVAENFPGVNAEPITYCVIDNATSEEVFTIAQAALVGGTFETARIILAIAERPETAGCIAEATLAGGLF